MTSPPRAKPFVTQMRRGQLPASSCRHQHVDGHHRQSGRNAFPKRDHPPSNIMSPIRNQPGSWTEIRLGARARNEHNTTHTNLRRVLAAGEGMKPAIPTQDFNSEGPDSTASDSEGLTGPDCTDKEPSSALGGRLAGSRERIMRSRMVVLYRARPALACIIGARRAWTVEMISSEEMPCK